jgi:hypothetical protein
MDSQINIPKQSNVIECPVAVEASLDLWSK